MLLKKSFWIKIPLAFFLSALLSGCGFRMIAPFDAKTQEETFASAKLVNQFYGQLLETDEAERNYASFSAKYVEIEAQLDTLVLRNKVRDLNEDSVDIVERIVKLWRKYKARHKQKDTYSSGSAKLDRQRMERMFSYAVRAEGAKKPTGSSE